MDFIENKIMESSTKPHIIYFSCLQASYEFCDHNWDRMGMYLDPKDFLKKIQTTGKEDFNECWNKVDNAITKNIFEDSKLKKQFEKDVGSAKQTVVMNEAKQALGNNISINKLKRGIEQVSNLNFS